MIDDDCLRRRTADKFGRGTFYHINACVIADLRDTVGTCKSIIDQCCGADIKLVLIGDAGGGVGWAVGRVPPPRRRDPARSGAELVYGVDGEG